MDNRLLGWFICLLLMKVHSLLLYQAKKSKYTSFKSSSSSLFGIRSAYSCIIGSSVNRLSLGNWIKSWLIIQYFQMMSFSRFNSIGSMLGKSSLWNLGKTWINRRRKKSEDWQWRCWWLYLHLSSLLGNMLSYTAKLSQH